MQKVFVVSILSLHNNGLVSRVKAIRQWLWRPQNNDWFNSN